jgi:hypothetical protein
MAQLVDLSGLGALTEVNELAIANNANLTALTGAPPLWGMNAFDAIENPKLTQAAIDGFVESLTKKPAECIGEWGDCSCSGEPELHTGSERGVKVEVVVLDGGGPVDPREHHSLGGRRRRGQEADFGVLLRNYSDHFGA